jgi:hypothetical protein
LPEIGGRQVKLQVVGLLADTTLYRHRVDDTHRQMEERRETFGLLDREIKEKIVGGHQPVAGAGTFGLLRLQVVTRMGRQQCRERLRHDVKHRIPKELEIKHTPQRAVEPVALQVKARVAILQRAGFKIEPRHGQGLPVGRFQGEVGYSGVAIHTAHVRPGEIHINVGRHNPSGIFPPQPQTVRANTTHISGQGDRRILLIN